MNKKIDDKRITLIFPMAGKGERFGYKFKPFLEIGGYLFIQRAVSSFDKYMSHMKEVVFIYLKEQEKNYNVNQRLKEIFPALNFRTVILENPTKGPVETVRNAIKKDSNIKGPVIICDCDHYLDTAPLFKHLIANISDSCVIPLWSLKGEDIKSWSVATLSDNSAITGIAEKQFPKSAGRAFGVIGCYFFNDASLIANDKTYISEIIQDLISNGEKVSGTEIFNAEFFGDPQRLQNALLIREKGGT